MKVIDRLFLGRAGLGLFLLSDGLGFGMDAEPQPFDVPRLEGITIDGNPADWGDRGLRVEALKPIGVDARPMEDFDARFRLGWCPEGLLLLAVVSDNAWVEEADAQKLWRLDSLELYLAPQVGDENVVQWVLAPGMAAGQTDPRWTAYDHRKQDGLKSGATALRLARTRLDVGPDSKRCVLEALLPWSALSILPEIGRSVGFQIWFNDADKADAKEPTHFAWFEGLRTFRLTNHMHCLRLTEKAGPTERLYPTGRLDMPHNLCRFYLIGDPGLAGQPVDVLEGTNRVATATLEADPSGHAVCRVAVPLPPFGMPLDLLTVRVNGDYATRLGIGGADWRRMAAFMSEPYVFERYVFDEPAFPAGAFAAPKNVEKMLGPHTVTTSYYAADFRKVEAPEAPGRYGAIITVTTATGASAYKYATLFHHRKPAPGVLDSAALGLSEAIVKDSAAGIQKALERGAAEDAAWLGMLNDQTRQPAAVQGPWATTAAFEDAWWSELKKRTGAVGTCYRYGVYLPKDYAAKTRWPVFLYLHGGGLVGGGFERFKREGLPLYLKDGSLPFVVVVPHEPQGYWNPGWLCDVLDAVRSRYTVDPDRVCVLGHSLGAKGAAAFVQQFPYRPAAVVMMGGGGGDVTPFIHIPTWMINGEYESAARRVGAERFIEALNKAGGQGRNSVIPGQGHGVEGFAMAMPELQQWLLQQRRGRPAF